MDRQEAELRQAHDDLAAMLGPRDDLLAEAARVELMGSTSRYPSAIAAATGQSDDELTGAIRNTAVGNSAR